MLIDTHCHIHESSYPLDSTEVLLRAQQAGVEKLICVGTTEVSSQEAVSFSDVHEGVFAAIGVHPHDTKDGWSKVVDGTLLTKKVVAVGEIGLDYYYMHSSRKQQVEALEAQIDFALKHTLPIIFHVREAYDDFWPIFDNFHGIRGELHSFTDSKKNLEAGIARGLYVGVNGISTFTKDDAQKSLFATIPLERLLLETDAPFLTPTPFRGNVNEPAFVKNVAEHHARVRNISFEEVAAATSTNANALFAL